MKKLEIEIPISSTKPELKEAEIIFTDVLVVILISFLLKKCPAQKARRINCMLL